MPLSSIVSRCVALQVTHASAADSSGSPRFGFRRVQWGGWWRGAAEVSCAAGLLSGQHMLPLGKCVPPRPPSALTTICCVTPFQCLSPDGIQTCFTPCVVSRSTRRSWRGVFCGLHTGTGLYSHSCAFLLGEVLHDLFFLCSCSFLLLYFP